MADDTTPRGYPLPHPDNNAADDAQRLRAALGMIDTDLTGEIEAREVAASETQSGRVQLATSAEASAGTATDRVPAVARVKAMIQSAVSAVQTALQTALSSLQVAVAANKAAAEQAVSDLSQSVATSLGTKLDKAGGTITGSLTFNRVAGAVQSLWGTVAGKSRWAVQLGDATAEAGANAGSNFAINRYADNGNYLDTPLAINRATGVATLKEIASLGAITASGTISSKNGHIYSYGYAGDNNQGGYRFNEAGSAYLHYVGGNFSFTHTVSASNGRLWGASDFGAPVQSMRLVYASTWPLSSAYSTYVNEIMTGVTAGGHVERRVMQFLIGGNWYTVGAAS